MDVLVTGANGRCGTALADHLGDESDLEFTFLDRTEGDESAPGGGERYVADVRDYEACRPAFDGQDAVVHLAGYPHVDGDWDDVHGPNILGTYTVLEAARDAGVGTVVFASSNHVQGMYEAEFAPALYRGEVDLELTHEDPVRPDSYYGTSKAFGEVLCRQYVENYDAPEQCYALRICSVRRPAYDHPYGDAERGVANGEFERGSEAYQRRVARMKAMWHSRRDFAHEVECCLRDGNVQYGVFNGVSDNDRRWFSIEGARERIDYDPQDDGETWDGPPE